MGELTWKKSSYSGSGGGNCVEVASMPGRVLVRDTHNREGATLSVDGTAWAAFLTTLKQR